jgi:hypothetical protein
MLRVSTIRRLGFRLVGVLAYGCIAPIYLYAESLRAQVYDGVCAKEGMTFGVGTTPREAGIAIMIIAAPLLLARANISIGMNVSIALASLFFALFLPSTAKTSPYECFTQAGTYEDNVSGVDGFGYYLLLVVVVSYIWVFIDLLVWGVRKLAHWSKHQRGAGEPTVPANSG